MADFGMIEPPHTTSGPLWRLELIATLLLGLSAVGAGWTAYQAARWSSDQTFTLDRANRMHRQAAGMQNEAYLLRVVDVGMFISYAQAVSQGNNLLADFLLERFRPPMKAAVRARIATKPLKNPNAPHSPFAMKEYRLQQDVDARRLDEQAEQALSNARRENRIADNYILVTVPFAIVSLFCGLSTKFILPGIRTAIVSMAFAIFVGAVAVLFFMPVS